jgi:hypothetical protein
MVKIFKFVVFCCLFIYVGLLFFSNQIEFIRVVIGWSNKLFTDWYLIHILIFLRFKIFFIFFMILYDGATLLLFLFLLIILKLIEFKGSCLPFFLNLLCSWWVCFFWWGVYFMKIIIEFIDLRLWFKLQTQNFDKIFNDDSDSIMCVA